MRPTIEDLQSIWLFTYSRSAFIEAEDSLDELRNVPSESLQYRALVAAAITAYMQPFTPCFIPPNRKVIPFKDVPIPEHLARFHEDAMNLRDTMIGHMDATPADGYTASPNIVTIRICPDNRFILHSATIGEMEPESKNGLLQLCGFFRKYCNENLSRLTKACRSALMKHGPGQYELVISEPPADWLIPFRIKHGEDFRK